MAAQMLELKILNQKLKIWRTATCIVALASWG